MSDQDKPDHWGLLASGLGATPHDDEVVESAESEEPQSEEPSPQAEAEEPIVEFSRPSAAAEAVPPTDWGQLAGDLGVDVDESALGSEEASVETPLLAEPGEPNEVRDEVRQELDNELAELALDAREGGGFASGIFSDPLDVESDTEEADTIADPGEIDALVADVDTVDADTVDADTVDTGEPPAEKKPGRRRRRRRPRGRKSNDSQTDTPSEPATDNQSDEAVSVVDGEGEDVLEIPPVADETESGSSDSDEPPAKPRRRRRRRRGSGRKTTPTSEDEESADEESADEGSLELDAEPEVPSDATRKRRGRRRTSHDVEAEGDSEGGSEKAARSSHRAIPSWAEAIEGVISANLENHKKSSSGGSSRSRGGRKRGGRDRSSSREK